MIENACRITCANGRLSVQIADSRQFDSTVLLSNEPMLLQPSSIDTEACMVHYPVGELVSLNDFLVQTRFDPSKGCCFLHALFDAMEKAMKDQPAVLSCDAIFTSCHADAFYFVRAPLVFEAWMKRHDDLRSFYAQLLERFDGQPFELIGLLYKAFSRSLSLDVLKSELESLYKTRNRNFLFSRSRMRPYHAQKPVYPLANQDGSDRISFARLAHTSGAKEQEMSDSLLSASENSAGSLLFQSADPDCTPSRREQKRKGGRISRRKKHAQTDSASQTYEQSLCFESRTETTANDFESVYDLVEDRIIDTEDACRKSGRAVQEKGSVPNDRMQFLFGDSGTADSMRQKDTLLQLSSEDTSEKNTVRRSLYEPLYERDACQPMAIGEKKNDGSLYRTDTAGTNRMAQRNERTEEGDLNGFNSSEDLRIPLCSEEDFFCGYANANSIDRTEPEAQMKTSSHLMPQMEMEKGEREPTLLLEEFAPQAWLEDEYRRFALCGSEVLIGRDENCAVVLLDPSVSGTHAKLTCAQERWYVQDLKSTNGTRLDRKKVIRRMRLKEGMTLHLGNVELVFHE